MRRVAVSEERLVPSGAEKYVLGADLGTSGLKMALVSTRGRIVDTEILPLSVRLLPGGGSEQDPEQWWAAIRSATRAILARAQVPRADLVGFNVGAQWSGTVPVDADFRALGPAIIWMDARGAEAVRRVTGGFPRIEGYSARRLFAWIRLTGGAPTHSGKDPIAHVLWLKRARPDVYRAARLFLKPKDYLNLRLSGRAVASFDSITLHWLTDNRDIAHVRYHDRLLRWAGIDRTKLPDLVPPASVLGPILPEVGRELGLPEHVAVVSGMPDLLAAAIGSGAVRDFEAHLSLGTSSWLMCHVPRKKTDLFHNMASLPSAIPGRYILTNEQESAGICLAALRDNVFYPDDGLGDGPAPGDAFGRFDRIAGRAPPGSGGLIFMPWLNGERTPVDDRTVRGGFFNQTLETTRAHMVRAVLEGVAYNSRWLLTYVERFVRRRLPVITMIGGGAGSDLWCQIHADVLGRTIRQVEDPMFANARGASLQAAVALGHLAWEDVPGLVPIARTFEPDPANAATYDALFREFVHLYRRNRRAFARLNRAGASTPPAVRVSAGAES